MHRPFLLMSALVGTVALGCVADPQPGAGEILEGYEVREEALLGGVPGYDQQGTFPSNTVYLTFDDGPGHYTGAFLDKLREHGVPATFFVNMGNLYDVGADPKLLQALERIVDEGHTLANHTFDHPNVASLTAPQVAWQLDHNEAVTNQLLRTRQLDAVAMTWFRNPFGSQSTTANQVVAERAMIALWNIDSSDSADWATDANGVRCEWHVPPWNRFAPACVAKIARVSQRVIDGVRSRHGGVVLMHDIHPTSWAALDTILPTLKNEGYRFATLEHWARSSSGIGKPSAMSSVGGCASFPQTGQELCGRLKVFWEINGGLPVFGYPKSPMRVEVNAADGRAYWTQWFERNRLEIHPENERPYHVLLGLLGVERLRQQGIQWETHFPTENPRPGCIYFSETGHNVCNQSGSLGFRSFWMNHGLAGIPDDHGNSLALFGLPISDAHVETIQTSTGTWTGLVQWFERARFEWHPEIADDNYKVLLGLLGNEMLEQPSTPKEPCRGLGDGTYCGRTAQFSQRGETGRLYECLHGNSVQARRCLKGCRSMPSGQADRCE